jgi:hypothetical protein
MSDASERPAEDRADRPDADAWAAACEEDLAAEQARRREQYGAQPASAAEELRRLADAVSQKISEIGKPFAGSAGPAAAQAAAQGMAQQFLSQAKSAIEPVVERNPDLFGHLAAAGNELLAAYQSAVRDSERLWTSGESRTHAERTPTDGTGSDASPPSADVPGPAGFPAPGHVDIERIDLDKDAGRETGHEPGNEPGTEPGEGRDKGPGEGPGEGGGQGTEGPGRN